MNILRDLVQHPVTGMYLSGNSSFVAIPRRKAGISRQLESYLDLVNMKYFMSNCMLVAIPRRKAGISREVS